jgi:hypothetical protein
MEGSLVINEQAPWTIHSWLPERRSRTTWHSNYSRAGVEE